MRLFVLLTALLMLLNGQAAAQTNGITIVTPVTGDFAFASLEESLQILNTETGSVTTVANARILLVTERMYWNNTGTKIAYIAPDDHFAWYDFVSQTLETRTLLSNDVLYYPVGWSADGDDLLIRGVSEANPYPQRTITLYRYTTANNESNVLRSYNTGTTLTDIPNPQGQIPYTNFGSLVNVTRNPFFSDWIVGDYHSTDDETNLIVHNLVTNQTTQIKPLFPDEDINESYTRWSPDGTKLIVQTTNFSTWQGFLHIMDFDGNGGITLKSTAQYDVDLSGTVGWLGVDDIFIRVGSYNSNPNTTIYFLNQIIDGILYTQEFFTVDGNIMNLGAGDFYLRADDAEKHQLSCMFDQALPTQLSIGARARVNFTDGTPLRLRDAPSFDANEITQMAKGTEFDIIGGKACVNAESYYRFWQLELDNGTTGWAAEANLTDYFMEPVD